MYYYIYKMTNPNTGEFYIGRRKTDIEPELDIKYRGSMLAWSREENFDKTILVKEVLIKDIQTFDELCELESSIIESVIKDPLNKNAHIPSKGFVCKGHSKETRQKLSEHFKGKPNPNYPKKLSDEARKNMSEAAKGRIISDETKEKLSNALSNRKLTEEHKSKIGEQWKTRVVSEETGKKISDSNKGKPKTMTQKRIDADSRKKGVPRTEEVKEKMRKPKSEETKDKMRKPKSPEHVAKIAESRRRNKEERERLKNLNKNSNDII
jgi:hypothetical protein